VFSGNVVLDESHEVINKCLIKNQKKKMRKKQNSGVTKKKKKENKIYY